MLRTAGGRRAEGCNDDAVVPTCRGRRIERETAASVGGSAERRMAGPAGRLQFLGTSPGPGPLTGANATGRHGLRKLKAPQKWDIHDG